MKTIEVCSSGEWWTTFGPAGEMANNGGDYEAVNVLIGDVCDGIRDLGFEAQLSTGQRGMCHGWNGANTFARKQFGIGTLEKISDAEWDALTTAVLELTEA